MFNLVEAVALALRSEVGGRPFFVTDGEDRSIREVLTGLVATRGVVLPERSLPGWLGRVGGAVVEGAWGLVRPTVRPPITAMAMAMLSATVTVRDAAAREVLGYRPVIGWDEGLAGMAAERAW